MIAVLVLGFLLGMRHALEADHLAAVATLATRSRSLRETLATGVAWGVGHTLTLFLGCSVALFVDAAAPEALARALEAAVGAMLVVLGLDLVRRMVRDRAHVHLHQHDDGTRHLHIHTHARDRGAGERVHSRARHVHTHRSRLEGRALFVGLVHGLAGSAALILLSLGNATSPLTALAWVGMFGVGSIAGMAILSVVISVPLKSARKITALYNGLQTTVAAITIVIGGTLLYQNLINAHPF